MTYSFKVLPGSERAKSLLAEILHVKGEEETRLKEFLADLERNEVMGRWWLVIDENDVPKGALTVRDINEISYLKSIWTRTYKLEEQFTTSHALIQTWIGDNIPYIYTLQADLPLNSPFVDIIQEFGFHPEKLLLCVYEVDTEWKALPLPEGYHMRAALKEELIEIYDHLIAPDLDPESPIFVTREGFLNFARQISKETLESWVVVEDDSGKIVGFGASFMNELQSKRKQAVLFGPHSTESMVQKVIIAETMSYWRAKGVDSLRILRVNEFYPSVIKDLDLIPINSTVRYVYEKY